MKVRQLHAGLHAHERASHGDQARRRHRHPVRVQLAANVVGSFINTATGERFRDHGAHLVEIDLTSGTVTQSGLVFIYHRHPGGLVFLDAGRVMFDAAGNVVFKAGPDGGNRRPGARP